MSINKINTRNYEKAYHYQHNGYNGNILCHIQTMSHQGILCIKVSKESTTKTETMKHWKLTALTWDGHEVDSTKVSAHNRAEAVKTARQIMQWQGLRNKYTLKLIK